MRTSLVAGLVVAVLLARMDSARSAPLPDNGPTEESVQASDASLALSAAKATTYQIATTSINFALFLAGTGSIVDGSILTVYNTAKSWVVYTVNDYAWDAYSPANEAIVSSTAFDARRSFWRTTGKVLTYRPVDTALKFAAIYYLTESVSIMIVYGTASSVASTGVFYVNNFAWDVYIWSKAPLQPIRRQ